MGSKIDNTNTYHPEPYWSEVASRIRSRSGKNVIAGDDEPFYRYKRERFLSLLKGVTLKDKNVLEVGSGPGGNLNFMSDFKPKSLTGVDISAEMIALAKANVNADVSLVKVDGTNLPFPDNHFDVAITATVLQHNSDDLMVQALIKDICRVTSDEIHIFEKCESTVNGDALCMARPISYYQDSFKKHGFELTSTKFINIRTSYLVCGIIRKGLNGKDRKEGEALNAPSVFLQNLLLPVTSILDKVFVSKTDLCHFAFKKIG